MNRNAACCLTLIVLLAACASPATTNISTEIPLTTANLPAVPTLAAASLPQATMTMTVIPPCEAAQKAGLKLINQILFCSTLVRMIFDMGMGFMHPIISQRFLTIFLCVCRRYISLWRRLFPHGGELTRTIAYLMIRFLALSHPMAHTSQSLICRIFSPKMIS